MVGETPRSSEEVSEENINGKVDQEQQKNQPPSETPEVPVRETGVSLNDLSGIEPTPEERNQMDEAKRNIKKNGNDAVEETEARETINNAYQTEVQPAEKIEPEKEDILDSQKPEITPEEASAGIREGLKSNDAGIDLEALGVQQKAEAYARKQAAEASIDETIKEIEESQKQKKDYQEKITKVAERIDYQKDIEKPAENLITGEKPETKEPAPEVVQSIAGEKGYAEKIGTFFEKAADVMDKYGAAAVHAGKAMLETYRDSEAKRLAKIESGEIKGQESKESLSTEEKQESKPQRTAAEAIVLHCVQKAIEYLRSELGEKNQGEAENTDLKEFLSAREKIAEKITGKNMAERMADAEKKAGQTFGYERRIDYINALTGAEKINVRAEKQRVLLEAEFAKLTPKQQKKYANNPALYGARASEGAKKMGLSEDEHYALLNAGYKPVKNKGFFSLRLSFNSEKQIIMPDGKKVWMKEKDFASLVRGENGLARKYDEEITKESQNRLDTRWNNEVAKQIESSMAETANDLNGAMERTKSEYGRMKEALLLEFIGSLSEKQLTPAQIKARNRLFGGTAEPGKDIDSFFGALSEKTGKFSGINGNVVENRKLWTGALNDYGFKNFTPDTIKGMSVGPHTKELNKKDMALLREFLSALQKVVEGFNVKKNKI